MFLVFSWILRCIVVLCTPIITMLVLIKPFFDLDGAVYPSTIYFERSSVAKLHC